MNEFDVITVGSSLHDAESLGATVAGPMETIAAVGGRVRAVEDPGSSVSSAAILVGTGGSEAAIIEIWEARPGEPLLLLAHPGQNSLPSALEALARVQQLGGRGRIVYLDGDDTALLAAVGDLQVRDRLGAIRIGLIGPPSDWLVASSPDPEVVRAIWGPEVVPVPIDRVVGAYHPAETGDIEMSKAEAIEAALRELISAERLDAVTVRCFDLIGELDTTACLALSSLNDDDVIAGCEGDLVSAVGLLWVHHLLGEVPWMANPARLDTSAGTVTLAHCTVPRGLVARHRLDTHFESDRGIGIAGEFRPGPVTLLRIGGTGMERLWLAEGEIVATGDDPALCRTQIDVRLDGAGVEDLLTAPLGNHLVVAPGHHAARLGSWWEWLVG